MAVRIVFLGPLRDLAGREEMEVEAPLNWESLLGCVGSEVADVLKEDRVNIACRGKVLQEKSSLNAGDGDEVALLPPVSGG